MKVRIKKLNPLAIIPSYAKDGDAGMDLVATSIISDTTFDITYGLGISMEIPEGFVGLVFPRSSIRKYDLALTNCVGVIDSDEVTDGVSVTDGVGVLVLVSVGVGVSGWQGPQLGHGVVVVVVV